MIGVKNPNKLRVVILGYITYLISILQYKHDCTKQQYVPNEALGLLCGIIAVMVIEGVKLTTTLFSTYVINSEFWVLGFEIQIVNITTSL